jgi:hypothetical protein
MCKKCYESHQSQKSFVSLQSKEHNKVMDVLNDIYTAIAAEGLTAQPLQMIDNYANDIQNGREDFSRFNLSEHAGLCKGGSPLIGASIIACYASASLRASCNAEGRTGGPANWEIDEQQEKLIEQWAKAANLWEDDSEHILTAEFGPMIAQGAEAKVYYSDGNTSVVKERTSIYSTWQKALDAIVLHNYLFPETAMKVIGFTRDSDGLMRIVLTQPYVNCLRLATKEEIDDMVSAKGFRDNWNGEGVNYISDRLALEDMHPANVFVDTITGKPICIDCIVKFVSP